jgi:hypothetical protein
MFSVATEGNARPSICVRNQIIALHLLELCSSDATRVGLMYACGGGCEHIVTSAYLPFDRQTIAKQVAESHN